MLTRRSLVAVPLLVALLVGGCSKSQPPATPQPAPVPSPAAKAAGSSKATLYIPCGMIIPFTDAIDEFKESHPGAEIETVYDNAVVLAEKVLQKGATPDVFVSPGFTEIGRLAAKGLVDEDTRISVAKFELVVITRRDSKLGIESLADLRKCRTISMPEPGINSVGTAAKEALQNLGLWAELKPKLLFTRHAIESHQFVSNHKSDAGFAYNACPLETAPEKLSKMIVRPAFFVDKKLYRQQECVVAVMKNAPNPRLAKQFVKFMDSDVARRILEKDGLNGCVKPAEEASVQKVLVKVTAFYPGNEGHRHVRDFIAGLNQRWDGKVRAEFVDFTSKEGFHRWRKAGLSCGTVVINGSYEWTYKKPDGSLRHVAFQMGMGGQWTQEDVIAVIEKILKEQDGQKPAKPES